MNDPRRLKDDPEFLAETGCALGDEQLVVGQYDLAGLRQRVVSGAPVAAATPWWKIAFVSGVTASLVTFGLLQLMPGERVLPAPPSAEPVAVVGDTSGLPAPRAVTLPEMLQAVPDEIPVAPLATPEPIETPEPEPLTQPEPPIEPVPTAPVEAPPDPEPTPTSSLAQELADFNRGVSLSDAGDWNAASTAWDRYLTQWPEGRMRTEARLGKLRALVNADRFTDAERLAGQLLATPGLGAHRDALRLVRGEALAKLGRCDEALDVVDGLKRSSRLSALRSECRRASRDP